MRNFVLFSLTAASFISLASGCVSDDVAPVPGRVERPFWEVYAQKVATTRPLAVAVGDERSISVSAAGVPLGVFCRNLVRDTGASIVVDSALDGKLIYADVRDRPLSEVLQLIARRFGAQLAKQGGTYYLGALRAEDKGVLVRRVARLSSEELSKAVSVLLSQDGRTQAYPDGVVVVGDKVEVLDRVSDLLDRVESVGADSWVLQALFVSRRKSHNYDLGVDVTAQGTAGVTLNQQRADRRTSNSSSVRQGGGTDEVDINIPPVTRFSNALAAVTTADTNWLRSSGVSLSGVLSASIVESGGKLVAAPLLLVSDGERGKINVGQRVPIPRRNVSPEGTVTTVGFDYLQTGTQIDAAVREVDKQTARVKLLVSVTSFDGFSPEGGAIVSPSEIDTVVSVNSGGVYLVGSLANSSQRQGRPGPISLGLRDQRSDDVIDVWLRVYRVSGPAKQGP